MPRVYKFPDGEEYDPFRIAGDLESYDVGELHWSSFAHPVKPEPEETQTPEELSLARGQAERDLLRTPPVPLGWMQYAWDHYWKKIEERWPEVNDPLRVSGAREQMEGYRSMLIAVCGGATIGNPLPDQIEFFDLVPAEGRAEGVYRWGDHVNVYPRDL